MASLVAGPGLLGILMRETFVGRDLQAVVCSEDWLPGGGSCTPVDRRWRGILLAAILAGFSSFAPASEFLDANGYPAADYELLNAWTEQIPGAPGGYVTGYHVRPRAGGPAIDLYRTRDNSLLDASAAAARGIPAKPWDAPGKSVEGAPSSDSAEPPRAAKPVSEVKSIPISSGVLLPELDVAEVLAEDAARAGEQGKGPQRVGVFRELEEAVRLEAGEPSHGYWQPVPGGGMLWSTALLSPGAYGIRVHFAKLTLPAGAYVQVYNAFDPDEAYGPYFSASADGEGLWSATCFADTAVVECFVPERALAEECVLNIDRIVHNYIPLGLDSKAKSAGTCNNDVTCYSAWVPESKGVGGIGAIGETGSVYCTGCLLSDTDTATEIPYFLTANHCISDSGEASTAEVYWFYQTSVCNGAAPNPATLPRTTGATYLASGDTTEGTDFCLLRLKAAPPSGVTYNGWSSAAVSLGTTTAVIHHPLGDFKRISFGFTSNTSEAYRAIRPADRFYQSTWTSGTTEPGSSGSPLFIQGTSQIIGQLWGGPGSCTTTTNMDYFGRFDKSYPLIAAYLDPPTATLAVVRPNTGKTWPRGERRRILWTSSWNAGERVRIELRRNGSFVSVLKPNTLNDGRAGWPISPALAAGAGYSIRIISKADASVYDESDVTFALR